KPQEVT
ncbi:hypothetical protein D046_4507B, partial [Vibrio parahaemolyticus V-223/04]